MNPRIEVLPEKKLVGMNMEMSFNQDRTPELWGLFMPKRRYVQNRVDDKFYSMQIYDGLFRFKQSDPNRAFQKWAAVEVTDFTSVENDFDTYLLQGGKYAVFIHNGPAHAFMKTFSYIFETWLPASEYELDNREHFECMTEDYHPADPNATEEVWIPIK
ncbi:GyrI-like domain-containing protein [Pseudalkalibacillus berkeleyi]|uniref:GyrI-like domain-containing protein n=1 Tax=Pseudalkalibacillus berkeleyi TaxID=1069813 RepID=A0ABS9GYB1_9BACL|nr:GyrI-like domain-containing protein [Pseudalkalibacillus berkeleyi]MCF6136595.1 GyrI-like domain-containing protein [Pseudalkalibacillus berkeleyi]